LYINNETLNNLFFKFQIIVDQREIFGPINRQQRTKNFVHSHDPKSTKIQKEYRPLLLCSSTDESGFDNQAQRIKGWSKIGSKRKFWKELQK
jgi:hypothetical protein